MRFARLLPVAPLLLLAAALSPAGDVLRPRARGQTEPMQREGDSADDPAIWLHPTRPELSLILGTDKQGGVVVYDLAGKPMSTVAPRSRPDNVDVLYGFKRRDGSAVDLAVASCRGQPRGIMVWTIDPTTRTLADATAGGVIRVAEPYGVCAFRGRKTGLSYAVVTSYSGRVEQYLLAENAEGKVAGRKVRDLRLRSIVEGCVADEELGRLYIAEEAVGIWRFDLEPDGSKEGKLLARVGENGLRGDVEGLAIYGAKGGRGYLIASSQSANTFKVYERGGDNAFVATIDPDQGDIDDVSDTDGIAVLNRPTSPAYPKGLFVVQDGSTPSGRQNFKIYGWEDVAGDKLTIDTEWSPRPPAPPARPRAR
jgi:3-phytase